MFKHDVHFDLGTSRTKIDFGLRAYGIFLFQLSSLNNQNRGTPFNCDFSQFPSERLPTLNCGRNEITLSLPD